MRQRVLRTAAAARVRGAQERTMDSNEMPGWLKVVLAVVAVVVLGPPALGLLLGALGLAIGLASVALKLGAVVLAIYAVVMLMRRVLAPTSTPRPAARLPAEGHLEAAQAQLEWE